MLKEYRCKVNLLGCERTILVCGTDEKDVRDYLENQRKMPVLSIAERRREPFQKKMKIKTF